MEFSGEVLNEHSTPQIPLLLEGSNFLDTSAGAPSSDDPSLACSSQNTIDLAEHLTGFLATAVLTMIRQSSMIPIIEDHTALDRAIDRAVRRLMTELRPILQVSLCFCHSGYLRILRVPGQGEYEVRLQRPRKRRRVVPDAVRKRSMQQCRRCCTPDCPGNSDILKCLQQCVAPCKNCHCTMGCRGVDGGKKCLWIVI